jgi:transposase-like protein
VNLPKLIEDFGSEGRCRAYLEELRWPDGLECPRCHGTTISRIHARNQFDCDSCRYQFSVTAGSTFHDSHLPLWKWFLAVYLVTVSKKGISSTQLKNTLAVSYKTAWYLSHRIREAMGSVEESPLVGVVEVDETLVGGKAKGSGYRGNKSVVIGAVQRGGKIRLRVIPNTRRHHVLNFIEASVDADATGAARHETVEHKAEEYVRGSVHHLSVKHLPAYLDEAEFRFNNRDNPFLFRDTLLVLLHSDPLPYKELVARKGPSGKAQGLPPIKPMDPEGH